jgi:hypothetical protein
MSDTPREGLLKCGRTRDGSCGSLKDPEKFKHICKLLPPSHAIYKPSDLGKINYLCNMCVTSDVLEKHPYTCYICEGYLTEKQFVFGSWTCCIACILKKSSETYRSFRITPERVPLLAPFVDEYKLDLTQETLHWGVAMEMSQKPNCPPFILERIGHAIESHKKNEDVKKRDREESERHFVHHVHTKLPMISPDTTERLAKRLHTPHKFHGHEGAILYEKSVLEQLLLFVSDVKNLKPC